MYTSKHPHSWSKIRMLLALVLPGLALTPLLWSQTSAAACQAPNADYGSVSVNLTIPATATYRIWTRMKAADTTNNTFALEVDSGNCYKVGGAGVPSGAWTWVDYQNGSSASKTEMSLTQGAHSLKLIGVQPGVQVDRIIAVSDLACVPTGMTGDDCNKQDDTTAPTVSITAPAADATVSGTTAITANASDDTSVARVEFYANSALLATDSSLPYAYNWDTTLVTNNIYTITAKAYDAAGNVATASRKVIVSNGDSQAPSVPAALKATATAYNKVELQWQASTDNVAVTGYVITRNGAPLTKVSTASYTDASVNAGSSYTYSVKAVDAAGNTSADSAPATVSTPNPADSQAPSKPTGLRAEAVSSSQVNLSWQASTDNVGVVAYDVYRQSGVSPVQKVATVTTTSFGDTTLKAYTDYSYHVKARDAAGNVSTRSDIVNVKTRSVSTTSQLIGTVSDKKGKAIPYAKVTLVVDGVTKTFTATSQGKYSIDNISGGSYVLVYTANGYKPTTISRIIKEGARVNQNVTLQKL